MTRFDARKKYPWDEMTNPQDPKGKRMRSNPEHDYYRVFTGDEEAASGLSWGDAQTTMAQEAANLVAEGYDANYMADENNWNCVVCRRNGEEIIISLERDDEAQ